jgi:lactate dehydrogenase-like 2-hydroxyacid dehydrogenase
MTDRLINIDNLCTNPDNHTLHICELTRAGKTSELDKLAKNPKFICGNCGKTANTAGALCAPGPLQS